MILAQACLALGLSVANADPKWTEAQASELRDIILSAKANEPYREVFSDDVPVYDAERKLWVHRNGWPRTFGGSFYAFEMREADGHYRLGWSTGRASSRGHDRFRIQTSIRRKIRAFLKGM